MNKLFLIFFTSIFCFSSLSVWSQDTIVLSIDILKYEKVAKEKLEKWLSDTSHVSSKKYLNNEFKTFSIPVFEWNQKAEEFTCESHERLENLLLFVENPYFQIISFVNSRLNIVGGFNSFISQIRTDRRIKDSIDWVSQIPNIPYSPFLGNPFPHYDLKELSKVYKYHLEHSDAFIFRIADYEGFWVVKDHQLYKLESGSLKNANQYLYMCGEEYIRDIARGIYRTGYHYTGCFSRNDSQYWPEVNNRIFLRVNK